jgi:hypothetical protein
MSNLRGQLCRSADRAADPKSQKVWVDLAQGWLDLAADIEATEEGRVPSAPVH